jgi:predicted nucleic acid-binding protein
MRPTLSLDDDVAAAVERLRRTRRQSLKAIVNEALREGLKRMQGGLRANRVPDAHLAALAIEHGLELCSTDGDFARFPGLRWQDPLTTAQ